MSSDNQQGNEKISGVAWVLEQRDIRKAAAANRDESITELIRDMRREVWISTEGRSRDVLRRAIKMLEALVAK